MDCLGSAPGAIFWNVTGCISNQAMDVDGWGSWKKQPFVQIWGKSGQDWAYCFISKSELKHSNAEVH